MFSEFPQGQHANVSAVYNMLVWTVFLHKMILPSHEIIENCGLEQSETFYLDNAENQMLRT